MKIQKLKILKFCEIQIFKNIYPGGRAIIPDGMAIFILYTETVLN